MNKKGKGRVPDTDGLTEMEMAKVLGTSYQNVQQCLTRYIRRLRWAPGDRHKWPSGGRLYNPGGRKRVRSNKVV